MHIDYLSTVAINATHIQTLPFSRFGHSEVYGQSNLPCMAQDSKNEQSPLCEHIKLQDCSDFPTLLTHSKPLDASKLVIVFHLYVGPTYRQ